MVIYALIILRLDYYHILCVMLLSKNVQKCQFMQYMSTRLRGAYILSVFMDLQCLFICFQSQFKILMLTFQQPGIRRSYRLLAFIFILPGCGHMVRSSAESFFMCSPLNSWVPEVKSAFSVVAPRYWNSPSAPPMAIFNTH